ncbi:prepilin-type N-terminal cleavage/methylation domain-containing protein [Metabacillus iocasae]|uniref:Prepilin-type N-terminal cleavage/methylation domain-containing protein n=1 Tax=Priestia iocasae TaxID=2291674 RepID=A0ABS2QPV0_9BACI|nr:prepilin-type N-terminal cleavage/methylation domain-containing protein [Metabacillus iocasae]
MKTFVKHIKNNHGLTLIELLATIVVMTIVMGVMYNVLANGISVSKKIGTEEMLRDEADYVVTMMMNELNSKGFDLVKDCSEETTPHTCVELVDSKGASYKKYESESESSSDVFYDVESEEKPESEQESIKLQIKETKVSHQHFFINDQSIVSEGNYKSSTIKLSCNSSDTTTKTCSNGILELNLHISDPSLSKPLQLESIFGF